MSGDRASLHLLITGRVQGVFYRASTQEEALRLRVAGWVKNLPDGRVEAYAVGSQAALTGLLAWCQVGPAQAVVERVESSWGPPTDEQGFEIRR